MQVNSSNAFTAFTAPESNQRKPLVGASSATADAAFEKTAAEDSALKAAEKPAEQAPRPSTNNLGQTIGSRLNVSA